MSPDGLGCLTNLREQEGRPCHTEQKQEGMCCRHTLRVWPKVSVVCYCLTPPLLCLPLSSCWLGCAQPHHHIVIHWLVISLTNGHMSLVGSPNLLFLILYFRWVDYDIRILYSLSAPVLSVLSCCLFPPWYTQGYFYVSQFRPLV